VTGEDRVGYRVVQPYGRKRDEWTLIGEHEPARQAFDAIDALSDRMLETGAPSDAIG